MLCRPVQEVAHACTTGAATNIIYGLALGYKSTIIPTACLCTSIYAAFQLASTYGVAICAIGMLSTLATGLTIDAYGPISDNVSSLDIISIFAGAVFTLHGVYDWCSYSMPHDCRRVVLQRWLTWDQTSGASLMD